MLNGVDLFSGGGGLTLALQPGVRPVAYCERDRFAQANLISAMRDGRLPVAPIWDDVLTLRGSFFRPGWIDIVYGGFPCQDISVAGLQLGLGGERSALFYEIVRLCEEIRAPVIFLENVPAIRTVGGEEVGQALAEAGYDCRWDVVSARELGAPHLRERWFLLGYSHTMRPGLQIARSFKAAAQANYGTPWDTAVGLVQRDLWSQPASDFSRMDDGLPLKTHRIKSLGNAVVPLQARAAFHRLLTGLDNCYS